MKVLLINGSPHEKGCTYTALSLIAKELNDAGVDTEILHVGGKPVGGCIGCGGCAAGNGCVFGGVVNEAIEKAKTADGFVFGSPVHYASASGNMTSFMDRLAYAGGRYLAYKPAAICCSAPLPAAAYAAPSTWCGMSWNLRSRNTLKPRSLSAYTMAGPFA